MNKQNIKLIGISTGIPLVISILSFIYTGNRLNWKYRITIIAFTVAIIIISDLAILLYMQIKANRKLAEPLNNKILELSSENKELKRHSDFIEQEYKAHINTLDATIKFQQVQVTQANYNITQQTTAYDIKTQNIGTEETTK